MMDELGERRRDKGGREDGEGGGREGGRVGVGRKRATR